MLPSKPGQPNLVSVPASQFFTGVHNLARANTTITKRYGNSARVTRPGVSSVSARLAVSLFNATPPDAATGTPPAGPSPRSASRSSSIRSREAAVPDGRHTRSIRTAAARPASDAMTSVSSTDRKFAEMNCMRANTTPTTSAIGHTSRRPRRPSARKIRISGTNRASNGVWRPTTAPISV